MPRTTPRFEPHQPVSEASSRTKRANAAADTGPERMLRRQLWKKGLRFRKNVRTLPGKPDIVFPGTRIAVFCDGDFWHGKDWDLRKRRLIRGANGSYWVAKIESNIARDHRRTDELRRLGWDVVRVWESEIRQECEAVAKRIAKFVKRSAPRERNA